MEKLKIAIACQNNSLPQSHFGDAPEFAIYTVSSQKEIHLEKQIANDKKDMDEEGHNSAVKRKSVVSLLDADTDYIVASLMSPNFPKIHKNTAIIPFVAKNFTLTEILDYFVDHFEEFTSQKQRKQNGEVTQIPMIQK